MLVLLNELRPYQDAQTLAASSAAALVPVIPLELGAGAVRICLFTVISTFGTAQDVTADELRIESFFPADKATDHLFRGAR